MKRLAFCIVLLGLPVSSPAWASDCGVADPDKSIAACTADILRHTPQRETFPGVLAVDHANRAIAYEKKQMPQEALADYDRAVALHPDFTTFFNRGNFHADNGDAARAAADLGEAIIRYERGARPQQKEWTEANYGKALAVRGDALRTMGRHADAVADYSKAAILKPEDDDLLFNRALAYSGSQQYDAAIADLDKVLALRRRRGNDVGALTNRGLAYMRKGDFARALADMDEVIRREGNSPSAYARRAAVWEAAGQRDKAITDFRQALQLYPTLPDAQAGLKRLGAE